MLTFSPFKDFNSFRILFVFLLITIFVNNIKGNIYSVTTINENKSTCIAPIFTSCPSNTVVNTDPGLCSAIVNYTAVASGIPSPVYTYAFTGATTGSGSGTGTGSTFRKGVTNVVVTATNDCGAPSCSFIVTVNDTEVPSITCSGTVTINTSPALCTGTTALTNPVVTDNCSSSLGNALHFDGANDKVGNISGVDIANKDFTIEAWLKRGSTGSWDIAVGVGTGCASNGSLYFGFHPGNNFAFTFYGNDTYTPNSYPDLNWHHWAATFNATTKQRKIYRDGVLVHTNTSSSNFTGGSGLIIGNTPCDNLPFHGHIDEVRIWNVERTQTQISSNMNAELSAQTGLIALYHFNQGIANGSNGMEVTATDGSGGGHNGTLMDFALSGNTSNWTSSVIFPPAITNNAPALFPFGNSTVTWTVSDSNGNTNTCNQTVTVVDNQAPVLTAPSNQTLNVIANTCAATYTIADPVTDLCSSVTWGYTLSGVTMASVTGIADGSNAMNVSFNRGLTLVTLTALDGAGNAATNVTFNVIVLDNIAPVITTCPNNLTLNTNINACFAVTTLTPPVVSHNCIMNLGNALNFDGSNDRVSQPFFARPTNYTIEAWVKLSAAGPRTIASWGSNSGLRSASLVIDAGFIRYYQYNTSYQSFDGYFGQTINDNTWHHVAITIAGAGGTASFNIYLDGILVRSYTGNLPNLPFDNFNIGANNNWNWFYQGDMDEVRIWNVARTANEIKNNYLKELPATTSNLILYHKFNQNIAGGNNVGTVNALATTGSNGVLNNFALNGATSNFVSSTSINNVSNNAPSPFPIGNTIVTWTVADIEGNATTCNQVVSVVDNATPSITCPASVTINTEAGICTANTTLQSPVVSDNCAYNLQNALNFDGIDDAVSCGTGFGNFGTGNFTIEGWFKISDVNLQNFIIQKRETCSHNSFWNIHVLQGRLYLEVDENTAGANYYSLGSPFVHNAGQWYHFACVRSGTSLRIYINGNLTASATTSGIANLSSTSPVVLGKNPCGLYRGNLDEIRVWNVARTITEIQQNMSIEIAAQTGLLANYHFNHGVSGGNNTGLTTLTDFSGNNFHGSLSNFALTGTSSNWIYEPTSGYPPIVVSNNAPTSFQQGITTVTWTVTDGNNNSNSCTHTVTVTDNQLPTISCPSNILVNNVPGECPAVVIYDVMYDDNCGGYNIAQTSGLPSGAGFPIGITNNSFIITDVANNSASCSFSVTVEASDLDLYGNGMEITSGDVMPDISDSTVFGITLPNISITRNFNITNNGNIPLNINSITSDDAEFTLGTLGNNLLGIGESTSFPITFVSNQSGLKDAIITFISNSCSEESFIYKVNASVGCPHPNYMFIGNDVNDASNPALASNWLYGCVPPTNDASVIITIQQGETFKATGIIMGDVINHGKLTGKFIIDGNLTNNGFLSPGN